MYIRIRGKYSLSNQTKHIKILEADDDIAMGHLLVPFSEILYLSFDFHWNTSILRKKVEMADQKVTA